MEKSIHALGATPLPAIPAKRYFTIGEVAGLCQVKPYVLRYWEQEFTQLNPMKRRGNRRYYQHHEVLLIRRIRDLLYEQGFTIVGARNRLSDGSAASHANPASAVADPHRLTPSDASDPGRALNDATVDALMFDQGVSTPDGVELTIEHMRAELLSIKRLLG